MATRTSTRGLRVATAGTPPTTGAWIRSSILILSAIGMVLSLYALYVEVLAEKISGYKALCDISPTISCSKVFTSRWGRGFGLMPTDSILNQPNSIFGLAFYVFQATLAFNPEYPGSVVQLVAAILSNVGSVYLGYILYFVLNDMCLVCLSIYLVNFLLLLVCTDKVKKARYEMLRKIR